MFDKIIYIGDTDVDIKLNDSQLKAADVNEDGKVDVLDAVMILRYEAGIIKSFES